MGQHIRGSHGDDRQRNLFDGNSWSRISREQWERLNPEAVLDEVVDIAEKTSALGNSSRRPPPISLPQANVPHNLPQMYQMPRPDPSRPIGFDNNPYEMQGLMVHGGGDQSLNVQEPKAGAALRARGFQQESRGQASSDSPATGPPATQGSAAQGNRPARETCFVEVGATYSLPIPGSANQDIRYDWGLIGSLLVPMRRTSNGTANLLECPYPGCPDSDLSGFKRSGASSPQSKLATHFFEKHVNGFPCPMPDCFMRAGPSGRKGEPSEFSTRTYLNIHWQQRHQRK